MKNLKISTALAAVTLAAVSIATPLSAQAYDNNRDCSDTSNGVLGAVVGGTAGAAIGDGIAGRGQSTEIGILGAIIGGIAGAAVGDRVSDCENYGRSNQAGYQTTTSYPTRSNGSYSSTSPVYTTPSTVYSTPSRTVYTSPRVASPVYQTQSPAYRTNTSYSSSRGFQQDRNRLFQIDREIDRLCDEIDYLKTQRRRSRHSSGLKSQIKQLEYRVEDLERERKHLKKYGTQNRRTYRSY